MNARATRRPHATRAYSRPVSTKKNPGSGGGGRGCNPFSRSGCLLFVVLILLVIVAAEFADKAARTDPSPSTSTAPPFPPGGAAPVPTG